MPPPDHRRPVAASEIAHAIDRTAIDQLLAAWVPEREERAFVVRCLLDEGPAHHRGANYALIRLLGLLLPEDARPTPDAAAVAVPLRLPPHLQGDAEAVYPLRLPVRALERLAPRGSRELAALVDALTDGPPQHALANVLMVCILDLLLERGAPP